MEKIRLFKKWQMIIATLFILTIGLIITVILANNKVMAATCQEGEHIWLDFYEKTEIIYTHKVIKKCDVAGCGAVLSEKTEECELTSIFYYDEEYHERECRYCRDVYLESHIDIDNDNLCDECQDEDVSTGETHTCDWIEREYEPVNEEVHKKYKVCSICGERKLITNSDEHTLAEYKNIGNGKHSAKCEECEYELTEEHVYENGNCECGQEEPTKEIEITSDKYELNNEYIYKVQTRVTVSKFKEELETNATEINIYNCDNEELSSSAKIGTGSRIQLKNGDQTKTFTIIVKGDANGDGEANFKDIVKINQARLNKATLEDVYSLAADVTNDGKIDFKDLVKINRFRLNKCEL